MEKMYHDCNELLTLFVCILYVALIWGMWKIHPRIEKILDKYRRKKRTNFYVHRTFR